MPRGNKKIVSLTVRIGEDVKATLEFSAGQERRSITNMLEVMILEYAKHLKETGGGVARPLDLTARKASK